MAAGAFSAGLSGLSANSQALSVVGNNLANLNTVGFKGSSVSFRDMVYRNVGGSGQNPTQIGLGVGVAQISPVFTQGTIESTKVGTNVAIEGNGFFMLNGSEGQSYTRAGAFSFDSEGYLVTPDGQKVQGYTSLDPTTGEINTSGLPADILVPPGVLRPPVATTRFSTASNLSAGALVGGTFTTTVPMYDSLGKSHITSVTYTKTGPGAWSYDMTVDGADVAGGTPGTPFSLGTGSVTFDSNGQLATINGGAPANVAITTPAWSNGATASALEWQIVDANNNASLTGFGASSSTSAMSQNGSAAGTVSNFSIGPDGTIVASVGAGQTIPVGQLALVIFNNPQGLSRIGGNRYTEGPAAGVRNIGIAGTGGRGDLIGSALEQSNVDMAQEFTQMILAQRGYQANSKMITVSDQLLVDTLNIKS